LRFYSENFKFEELIVDGRIVLGYNYFLRKYFVNAQIKLTHYKVQSQAFVNTIMNIMIPQMATDILTG